MKKLRNPVALLLTAAFLTIACQKNSNDENPLPAPQANFIEDDPVEVICPLESYTNVVNSLVTGGYTLTPPPAGYTPGIDYSTYPYTLFELYSKTVGTDIFYAEVFKYPSCETATEAGAGNGCTEKWHSNGAGACHDSGNQCTVKYSTTTGKIEVVCCD